MPDTAHAHHPTAARADSKGWTVASTIGATLLVLTVLFGQMAQLNKSETIIRTQRSEIAEHRRTEAELNASIRSRNILLGKIAAKNGIPESEIKAALEKPAAVPSPADSDR